MCSLIHYHDKIGWLCHDDKLFSRCHVIPASVLSCGRRPACNPHIHNVSPECGHFYGHFSAYTSFTGHLLMQYYYVKYLSDGRWLPESAQNIVIV